MKKILFVIILLSTIQVATAQPWGKESPKKRFERELDYKLRAEFRTFSTIDKSFTSEDMARIDLRNDSLMRQEISMPTDLSKEILDRAAEQQLWSPSLNIFTEERSVSETIAPITYIDILYQEQINALYHNINLYCSMIQSCIKNDSIDLALRFLEKAMKCDWQDAWLSLRKLVQEDIDQAIPFLHAFADRISKRDSISSPDELNLVLESFRAREKYEELIELYNRQKSIYSTYAPLYLYASIGYLGTGDMKNTVETYQKFKETFNPMDTSLGTYYAYTFDSLTIESMDNYVQWCQAVIHIENADFDDAIAIINNLPDTILDKDICLPFAITTNAKKGDYDIELRQSNRLVEMDPSADSYTSRGWVYYRRGEKDLAKADFQKVLVLESDSVTWNTAGAYLCLGDRRNAKRTARKLLSADSLSFEDYWLAFLFYESIGNERKSIKYIKQALSIATKEEKNFYPWIIWSYETPSLAAKVATIINQQ